MLTIQPASRHDIDLIMDVMNAAFDPAYGEKWSASQCSSMLTLPGCHMIIARQHDCAVGFALFKSVAEEAEILLIAVMPDLQGHGIGGALINAINTQCRNEYVARLFLEVRENNPALAFYLSKGFAQIGMRKDYYRGADGRLTNAVTLALDI